jgi:hypothetical protein
VSALDAIPSTTPPGVPSTQVGAVRSFGRRGRQLPNGWPLSALFLGFPLLWALGLASFVFVILAVPMAMELALRRGVRAPRGFGLWMLFLLWMLAGAAMSWADAPDAVPGGGGGGRLMVFAFRAAMYLAATIVLLYVLNADEKDLPTRRVVRLLGVIGMLACVREPFLHDPVRRTPHRLGH